MKKKIGQLIDIFYSIGISNTITKSVQFTIEEIPMRKICHKDNWGVKSQVKKA
jgi:hypothetical protein